MIIGILNPGSGIGDMLFSYVATRVRAADLGVSFGFIGKEYWKGKGWMDLDFGEETNIPYAVIEPSGAIVVQSSNYNTITLNKPYFDPTFNFIPDGSIIDGYGAQDIRYFEHRLDEVREWLKVDYKILSKNTCVLNFRGGEYQTVPELFLPQDYWQQGIKLQEPITCFEVHTDDPVLAKQMELPGRTIKDIALNWRSLRYAKNAIISNSAFAIIPRLLAHLDDPEAVTIAPFGWNSRNASQTKWLGRPSNYYPKFTYI